MGFQVPARRPRSGPDPRSASRRLAGLLEGWSERRPRRYCAPRRQSLWSACFLAGDRLKWTNRQPSLDEVRARIDAIDAELLRLVDARAGDGLPHRSRPSRRPSAKPARAASSACVPPRPRGRRFCAACWPNAAAGRRPRRLRCVFGASSWATAWPIARALPPSPPGAGADGRRADHRTGPPAVRPGGLSARRASTSLTRLLHLRGQDTWAASAWPYCSLGNPTTAGGAGSWPSRSCRPSPALPCLATWGAPEALAVAEVEPSSRPGATTSPCGSPTWPKQPASAIEDRPLRRRGGGAPAGRGQRVEAVLAGWLLHEERRAAGPGAWKADRRHRGCASPV